MAVKRISNRKCELNVETPQRPPVPFKLMVGSFCERSQMVLAKSGEVSRRCPKSSGRVLSGWKSWME